MKGVSKQRDFEIPFSRGIFVLFKLTSGRGLRFINFCWFWWTWRKDRMEVTGSKVAKDGNFVIVGPTGRSSEGHVGWRLVSWGAVFPSVPEQLSSLCPKECPHIVFQAVSGPLAAATASILTNPMDVIRTRVQVRPVFFSPQLPDKPREAFPRGYDSPSTETSWALWTTSDVPVTLSTTVLPLFLAHAPRNSYCCPRGFCPIRSPSEPPGKP